LTAAVNDAAAVACETWIMVRPSIRSAVAADYDVIASVVNDWWGRDVLTGLPRLFLNHFHTTSFVAENNGIMVGFLVGFVSPSEPIEAYIHYVAVDPARRNGGVARHLYEHFLERARRQGCKVVRAITSPANERSIAFHRRMGFEVSSAVRDYNGPGRDMVTFSRELAP
jgi:ribosomal protein S18 acetylase RimI-like enzyme